MIKGHLDFPVLAVQNARLLSWYIHKPVFIYEDKLGKTLYEWFSTHRLLPPDYRRKANSIFPVVCNIIEVQQTWPSDIAIF